ncbi:FecR family protein [Myxococcota bacterium]|nr:FecR family protein [Myxococcota bacterium]
MMQNLRKFSLSGLCLAAVLWAPSATVAEPVGFVAGVEGNVEIVRGSQSSWQTAALDQSIEIGDGVRTGMDSALKLVLIDDTTLTVGEDTEVLVDSFLVGDLALREPSVIRQLSGQLRMRVGEAFGGSTRVEIHTPTAVMGVKGTALTSRVSAENGEAVTLGCNWEGGVFMSAPNGNTSVDVDVNRCRKAYRDRIGPMIPVPVDFVPIKAPVPRSVDRVAASMAGSGSAPGPAAQLNDWLLEEALPAVGAGPETAPFEISAIVEPVIEGPLDAESVEAVLPPATPVETIFFPSDNPFLIPELPGTGTGGNEE